ncbi:MAG: hypothetical protein V4581_02955 [Bacteroidota bacterium]
MNKLLLWLLLLAFTAYAQDLPMLSGRITTDTVGMANVYVINKKLGTEVKTDASGNFSIGVKPGQTLVVYSDVIDPREFHISADSFINPPYIMAVELRGFNIEEVVIEQTVTSEGLGLVPKGQKRNSPEKKRVLNYQGNTSGLTGFINLLKGRKFLEEIKTKYAIKEMHLVMLQGLYSEAQLVSDFHIPELYAKAFYFYAVDDDRMAQVLNANQPGAAKLLLAELSLKYLEMLKEEE